MSEIRLKTCTRLEWVTKPSASSLVRSRQLLVRLFVNGSNTKQLSIAIGLGLHARFPLVRYRSSSERCRITPELHRGSRLAAFGGGGMLNMTPSQPTSMEVETLCFGAVSLPRVQDDSTASMGLWMGPCNVEYWACTFCPPIAHATLRIWRGSAKIPSEMCVNLVTNYKKSL